MNLERYQHYTQWLSKRSYTRPSVVAETTEEDDLTRESREAVRHGGNVSHAGEVRKADIGLVVPTICGSRLHEDFVFVLMPLRDDLEDLFIYGIQHAVEQAGYACLRASEIEHNSDILHEILQNIAGAALVIAEMTDRNPNVCYEVGIAHTMGKEVILIAKAGSIIPFDFQGKNHILYRSIRDLEERLTRRLRATARSVKS
jgi:hypothetical protein